jgi:hypothetical protein
MEVRSIRRIINSYIAIPSADPIANQLIKYEKFEEFIKHIYKFKTHQEYLDFVKMMKDIDEEEDRNREGKTDEEYENYLRMLSYDDIDITPENYRELSRLYDND